MLKYSLAIPLRTKGEKRYRKWVIWFWFGSVQSLSCVRLFEIAARQASLSITDSWSLLKLMFIGLVMPSSHLTLCHPLLLPPSIFLSIRVRWPKYWSFSFSICPSNEYSGLISFRMDWLDLLAVQETLKSLLQHRSLAHRRYLRVSWINEWKSGNSGLLYFLGFQNHCRWWLQPWN